MSKVTFDENHGLLQILNEDEQNLYGFVAKYMPSSWYIFLSVTFYIRIPHQIRLRSEPRPLINQNF